MLCILKLQATSEHTGMKNLSLEAFPSCSPPLHSTSVGSWYPEIHPFNSSETNQPINAIQHFKTEKQSWKQTVKFGEFQQNILHNNCLHSLNDIEWAVGTFISKLKYVTLKKYSGKTHVGMVSNDFNISTCVFLLS